MPGFVTITSPPASTALTTLANAKAVINITSTADDAFITSLIGRASSVIAQYCGRDFGLQTCVEIFRYGAGSYIGPSAQSVAPYGTPLAAQFIPISLSLFPVQVSTFSVVENSDSALTLGTDFDLDPAAGLAYRVRAGLRSWWNVPTVTATYSAGYVLPADSPVSGVAALPGQVEECALALVTAAYMRRGRDPSVILDVTEGVGRVGYAKLETLSGMAIDDSMASMLQSYRRMSW